jgi:hypothetical protein
VREKVHIFHTGAFKSIYNDLKDFSRKNNILETHYYYYYLCDRCINKISSFH